MGKLYLSEEGSDPSSPSSGKLVLYPKTDHLPYIKDSTGAETCLASVPGTFTATTSGTSKDVTGVPSWVKRITISFTALSTNGTSIPMVQIGDSGGLETSGYAGAAGQANTAPTVTVTGFTSGFLLEGVWAASMVLHGTAMLSLVDPSNNTWVWSFNGARSDVATIAAINSAGTKSLTGSLDRFRLTMVNGTDAFDAGGFNYWYD
jgi:hypothetical protein